jgi:Tol biopolymer transport system component
MNTRKKESVLSAQFGHRLGSPLLKLLFISAILALILSACGGGNPQLTYRAGGTASGVTVTYIDGEGNTQKETVSLPWEKTIEISQDTFDFQLVVANSASDGNVTCEILVGDEPIKDAAQSQAYIDCSGDISKSGGGWSYHILTYPVEAHLNDAQDKYNAGDYDQALAEIDKTIELAPNLIGAYYLRGLTLYAMQDYEQALSAYSKAIELAPDYVEAYNNRGLTYKELGDLEAAIADWTAALEMDPEVVNCYFNRSQVYFTQGDYEAAQADVLKVQQLSDDPEMLAWAESALDQLAGMMDASEPAGTETGSETTSPSSPSSGQWVLFTSVTDTQRVVNALNIENGDKQTLTPGTSFNWDAELSPDGKRIAFVSAQDGNSEIYVMNVDGSDLTRLTNDPAPDYAPTWSPDGSMIAFVSDRNGNADIYAMSADGSKTVQVTVDPAHDWFPTWNADGTEIAFVSERDGDAEIFIFNTDGSIRQLTDNSYYDADPAWSPNGRYIAFSSSPDGVQSDIYIIHPDGTGLQQVINDPAEDVQPAWSFDSNYILFASDRDSSTMEIYIMDESGKIVRLTNNDVDDRFPAWGPVFGSQ